MMIVGETKSPMMSNETAHATATAAAANLRSTFVAEACRGVGPDQEAEAGHDQVGSAVGEAVALVDEQRGREVSQRWLPM